MKREPGKFANRTLMSWQRKLLDALHHTNDHAYMSKAQEIEDAKKQARKTHDTQYNYKAMELSHDMDAIKERCDRERDALKVIINQAKMANVQIDREPLEREMAFARNLVNQLSDELTQARKRLVKHHRPKDEYFQYEIWFCADHIKHMREALLAFKPRGKKQTLTNERMLRRLRFAELLWKTDEELDNDSE